MRGKTQSVQGLTLIKAGALRLSGVHIANADAGVRFLQIFDAAAVADVTLGTTVPDYVVGVAASTFANGLVGVALHCVKGCVMAATTTAGGSTTVTSAATVSELLGRL